LDKFEALIPKKEQLLEKKRTLLCIGLTDSEDAYLSYLQELGYEIEKQDGEKEVNDYIRSHIPNVLLLDMDGLGESAIHITRTLKENPMTYTMPIIVVLGRRDLLKEIQVLDAGAEDFIAKPFQAQVLAARIHTSIRRNFRLQVSNPLTGLPGAIYIEEQTTKRLLDNIPTAMCYADLDYFKAFNDKYSYNRGDNVIRFLAKILNEGVSMYGNTGDFVGHIGGDDFIMVIDPDKIDKICTYVTRNFDTLIPFQYDEIDMARGYILSTNRQGEDMRFPTMTVSIGVVSNQNKMIKTYLDMTEVAAEMKEYAKSISKSEDVHKSTYRVDQRSD
jgi:diguanylate cyclase (GGDEF)-like protein